jgi:basic amino acid/polyamine antiporter, APA family
LAANHPVSGGTYEYGYRYLNPSLGFAAGWLFVCAKTASAATAALGFAGYLLNATQLDAGWLVGVAVATVVVVTMVVLAGIRLSSHVNVVIVSVTLFALMSFVVAGLPSVSLDRLAMTLEPRSFLHACALMFVAYTGYGRIATLGEEVRDPRRNIPRAIIATLVVSMLIYMAVSAVGVGAAGAEGLAAATSKRAAPLEIVSRDFALPVHGIVAIGAMTAMLGVLLNLVLGISRVVLAMGRRGDLPAVFIELRPAILLSGVVIAALAAIGSVKVAWSFSAFTVLVYYAVTNLAALRLSSEERLFSRIWAWGGLAACLLLAFSIEWKIWAVGLGVLAIGMIWHWLWPGRIAAR